MTKVVLKEARDSRCCVASLTNVRSRTRVGISKKKYKIKRPLARLPSSADGVAKIVPPHTSVPRFCRRGRGEERNEKSSRRNCRRKTQLVSHRRSELQLQGPRGDNLHKLQPSRHPPIRRDALAVRRCQHNGPKPEEQLCVPSVQAK